MGDGSRKEDERESAEYHTISGRIFPIAGNPFRCQVPGELKTLFEKIYDGEIPADVIHKDDICCAFRDISPQAPTHVLIVPKKPIPRIGGATADDQPVLGHLLLTAAKLATELGIAETGYRITINNGAHGGETVPHLHVHLLGGRQLEWPPG